MIALDSRYDDTLRVTQSIYHRRRASKMSRAQGFPHFIKYLLNYATGDGRDVAAD